MKIYMLYFLSYTLGDGQEKSERWAPSVECFLIIYINSV